MISIHEEFGLVLGLRLGKLYSAICQHSNWFILINTTTGLQKVNQGCCNSLFPGFPDVGCSQYKFATARMLTHKSVIFAYLQELLIPYQNARTLRSANNCLFVITRTRLKRHGTRELSHRASSLWNYQVLFYILRKLIFLNLSLSFFFRLPFDQQFRGLLQKLKYIHEIVLVQYITPPSQPDSSVDQQNSQTRPALFNRAAVIIFQSPPVKPDCCKSFLCRQFFE